MDVVDIPSKRASAGNMRFMEEAGEIARPEEKVKNGYRKTQWCLWLGEGERSDNMARPSKAPVGKLLRDEGLIHWGNSGLSGEH